jgi:hypothetical protein
MGAMAAAIGAILSGLFATSVSGAFASAPGDAPTPTIALPRDERLPPHKPLWNADLGRLLLGEILVKQFRRFAANQQLILCSFQEEDWPARIDDPLPRLSRIEPKQRLHEAISGLNRRQMNRLLRFSGDGSGEGVKWAAIQR